MALLAVLRERGTECVAAHCNFHLRGPESDRDEAFCRKLCDELGVRLLVRNLPVRELRLKGESVEMAARRLRYSWWEDLVEAGEAEIIAVGHHKEDNVETFMLNLLRGSGLRGLKGMLPVNGNIVRPLLDVSRKEIEDYLAAKGLGYVTDSTNLEAEYMRNKMRLNVLPSIERELPGACEGIDKSLRNLRGNFELYERMVGMLRERVTDENGAISVERVKGLCGESAETAMMELVRPWGLNASQARDILRSDDSGRVFGDCLLDRGRLLPPKAKETDTIEIDIQYFDPEDFANAKKSPDRIFLDADKLDVNRLELREWREGDRLKPFGMKGSKLVSDIFSDAHLSVREKQAARLLVYEDEILWVVGMRASRLYPVTPATNRVAVVIII